VSKDATRKACKSLIILSIGTCPELIILLATELESLS